MKRNLILKCNKDFYGTNDITFTKGKIYKGMIRFMINRNDGELRKAIRVRDDSNKRIFIYEVQDTDILEEHFTVLVDE